GRRLSDRRGTPPPVGAGYSPLAARGDAHHGRSFHRADRCAPVRLFPHRDADPAEGDRLPDRARSRPLRRPHPYHAALSGARLPDGRAGDDHPDGAYHLSAHHHARLRSDLVRRPHRHDGRAWAHPSAGRHEHIRHKKRGGRREDLDHFLRRAAVHRDGYPTPRDPDRVSDHCAVPAVADLKTKEEPMYKYSILAGALLFVAFGPVPARAADAAQMEQNKKTVMALYDAALNKLDFEEAAKYLGPRYTQHNPNAK